MQSLTLMWCRLATQVAYREQSGSLVHAFTPISVDTLNAKPISI